MELRTSSNLARRSLFCIVLSAAVVLCPALARAVHIDLIWTSTTGSGIVGFSHIQAETGDILELDVVVTTDAAGLVGASVSVGYSPLAITALSAEECPSPPNAMAGSCDLGADSLVPVTSNGTVGSAAPVTAGRDFNFDGFVGMPDFAALRAAFLIGAVPPVDPKFDLNFDNLITVVDYGLFIPNFGAPGVVGLAPGAVQMIEAQNLLPSAYVGQFTLGRIQFVAGAGGPAVLDIQYHAGVDGFTDNANNYHTSASVTGATITVSPASGVPMLSAPGLLLLGTVVTLVGARALARRRANC